MKKRALISVSDKNGVVDAAKRLAAMGYEIISTGGTQKCLEDAGLKTLNISDGTGFPECLDGRVKTLHPAVHAGLLAKRDNAEHMRRLKELKIQTIDVVIVNLYPFKQTVMSGKGFDEVVENIDRRADDAQKCRQKQRRRGRADRPRGLRKGAFRAGSGRSEP